MNYEIHDEKYIVFHRDEYERQTGALSKLLDGLEIPDAVVIRRQDLFASPALATYAASIAIAAKYTADESIRKNLLRVSDYFEQQAQAAADEGNKLPD